MENLGKLNSKRNKKFLFIDNIIILAVFIVIFLFFSFKSEYFLDSVNVSAFLITLSIIGFVSIGQTILLISGTFDISVGSIVGFSGVLIAKILESFQISNLILFIVATIFVVFIGGGIGLINGLIITKGRVNAIITTIATLSIISALSMIITKGKYIEIKNKYFIALADIRIGRFVPVPIIIFLIAVIIFYIILKRTVFGRYIYCIGSNENSAVYSGINVVKVRISLFVLTGMLSSIAGIILSSRLVSAHAIFGNSYPLLTVAACVIGGTLLSGGKGGVLGTLLGISLLTTLDSGFSIISIPTHVRDIITGLILMIAVIFNESFGRVEKS